MESELVPSCLEGAVFPELPGAAGVIAIAHYRRLRKSAPTSSAIWPHCKHIPDVDDGVQRGAPEGADEPQETICRERSGVCGLDG
jgi:hypothetical protein